MGLCSKAQQTLSCICRFLIQVLPAAVVAPLYFRGEIEFGVINQSSSAFNHILSDVSLVVYQVSRCLQMKMGAHRMRYVHIVSCL